MPVRMTTLVISSTRATALAAVVLILGLNSAAFGQNRPNLIFILTDDQGCESISALNAQQQEIFGNEMGCSTATMNQMARIGVSFRNCRVNPNCSPTRAGLLTGRRALSTGVTGVLAHFQRGGIDPCADNLVLLHGPHAKATDLTALQTYERTIAEALHDAGYYTILVDKWHVGGDHVAAANEGDDRGTSPDDQGFDEHHIWLDPESDIYQCSDKPDQTGDEHMIDAANEAVAAVGRARAASKEYALFFHTITPHRRVEDGGGNMWWKVADDLLYHTLDTGDTPRARFRQNVEAIDTVIRDYLLEPLEIITPSGQPDINFDYNTAGDPTVVFLLGDNGTDMEVTWYKDFFQEENHAKSSPYEGGIRVPLIVFGEKISGEFDPPKGTIDDRLVSHLDFFDTIADVAGIDPGEGLPGDNKRNSPNDPFKKRDGVSFADSIGYTVRGPDYNNEYTLSYLGLEEPEDARVAFMRDDYYKLIARGGDAGLSPITEDEFYYVPEGVLIPEQDDLLLTDMSPDEINDYYDMRDLVVDFWPLAVSEGSTSLTTIENYFSELYQTSSEGDLYVLVVHVESGELMGPQGYDEFYNVTWDSTRSTNLYPNSLNGEAQDIYVDLRLQAVQRYWTGTLGAAADVVFVDIPVTASRVVRSESGFYFGPYLAVGHENADLGEQYVEYRTLLKFDATQFDQLAPPEFGLGDIVRAQIIMKFQQDSLRVTLANLDDFWLHDAPTGPIRIHPVTADWSEYGGPPDLFDQINTELELGYVELPPHITEGEYALTLPDGGPLRETPMPPGTPVSFCHYVDIREWELNGLVNRFHLWYSNPQWNYGVALVATKLENVSPEEDQHVFFQNDAVLRLTLDRR